MCGKGWRVNKQSKAWQRLRVGTCSALMGLSVAAQTPQAVPGQTSAAGSTSATPVTGTSPQGVSPTAPAAPQAMQNDTTGRPGLPQAPAPIPTQPLYMRPTPMNYLKPNPFWPNPLAIYSPKNYPAPRLGNAPRLDDLLRDGKIYLSLADAVTLALENNYDIAIARVNLDIADTDIAARGSRQHAARCANRADHQHAGGLYLDHYGRWRTGRHELRQRRGQRWQRPGAEHQWGTAPRRRYLIRFSPVHCSTSGRRRRRV